MIGNTADKKGNFDDFDDFVNICLSIIEVWYDYGHNKSHMISMAQWHRVWLLLGP